MCCADLINLLQCMLIHGYKVLDKRDLFSECGSSISLPDQILGFNSRSLDTTTYDA